MVGFVQKEITSFYKEVHKDNETKHFLEEKLKLVSTEDELKEVLEADIIPLSKKIRL